MRHHPSKENIVWTVLFSLLAALALNGCGDSNNVSGPPAPIPLSPDAKLSSLTVTSGPLLPGFSSDVAIYTVDVATQVGSITVTAQPQAAGATVSINGQPTTNQSVPLGVAGSSTVVTVIVTAVSGSQNTYIVTINRAALGGNNNLKTLTVTSGTLSPAFAAPGISGLPGYTVAVASGVASVTVTAQAQDAGAMVSINNQTTTSLLVPLGAEGSSTLVTIEVTAQNGNPKNYFVTVNRAALASDAGLSNLQVSAGTLSPLFAAPGISGLPGYTVAVPNAITSITVTAVKADPNATLIISPSATVNNLPVGNTVFTIEVTALNGNQKTYFVTVNRLAPLSNNADLSALEVFAGAAATPPALALTPSPFPSATTSYTTAEADNTVIQVTIVATRADPNATMTIGGVASTGQTTVNIGDPGSTTQILIVVTPPSGPADAKTYTVDVPKAP